MHFDTVLDFWLGNIENGMVDDHHRTLWYRGSKEDDEIIKGRFMPFLLAASKKEMDDWLSSPRGRLAMIIILDQFSRNIFRGTAMAFLYDAQAIQIAKEGIELGQDQSLEIPERNFFYMPFQHSETEKEQEESAQLFASLVEVANTPEQKEFAESALEYAHQHQAIIKRFGRFPHRNEALSRQSTQPEMDYLNSGAARFGQ